MSEYIKGSRPKGERPKNRLLDMSYLQQTRSASQLHRELWDRAAKEGATCLGSSDYDSDDLPTDREAAHMCAPCPVFDVCDKYAKKAHPAWGVYAGKVYGRKLKEAMGDE